ncbi:MAG: GAF domain-containing sensor histidine kinase [Acidobacteria bacterium]|nr:GAF domain-containing sensor histidine kinase [Acidobacteriota bacterium]MCA1640785.1 GAF domain-containing sensor histidine kinase [Acidobacteriota bacterium]
MSRRNTKQADGAPPDSAPAAVGARRAAKGAGGAKSAPVPSDEAQRLDALRRCEVLDTAPEAAFDDIAHLAAHICGTPVALVSLVDENRQWFKARVGLDVSELPRDWAFCAHAILQHTGLFVVSDALEDECFARNPLVRGEPGIRFYAGVPLVTSDGHALGTLCVIDFIPRTLDAGQEKALSVLAHHAASQLELRLKSRALAEVNESLRREAAERARAEQAHEITRARERRTRAAAEATERHYRFLAETIPQQVWTAQPDGALDYVNRRALDYFSLDDASVLGAGWQQVVHPEDIEDSLSRWRRSLSTGETYEVEFRLRGASGEYRWHLARALPMRDAGGGIVKWFGTNTDIDEQKQLYRLAQEANQMKDQFLAVVSHELRTPLTSITGWAELLRLGILDEKGEKHAVEVIENSARAQAQLIGDLLDISRIITGKIRLNVQPLELPPVVEAALDVVRPAANARSIKLSARYDPRAAKVSGDPDRIQQIVWNLLSNAVKFTPEGGRVEVRLARVGAHAELTVSDTGVGIAPEFIPYVFDRFRQADPSPTRAHGGLGIGLAIVRHLAELHGGEVSAESAGEGHGATFRLRLPLLSANAKPDRRGPRTKRAAAAAKTSR